MKAMLGAAVMALALVASGCAQSGTTGSGGDGTPDATGSEPSPSVSDSGQDGGSSPVDDADTGEPGSSETEPEVVVTATGPYDRLIEVEMVDIAFEPAAFTVTAGETIRFRFVNVGRAPHEAVIGDEHVQEEHKQEMMMDDQGHDPGDDHGHHANGQMAVISLEPGEAGELDFTFTDPGELIMGCHVPGHYDAGMWARITVNP